MDAQFWQTHCYCREELTSREGEGFSRLCTKHRCPDAINAGTRCSLHATTGDWGDGSGACAIHQNQRARRLAQGRNPDNTWTTQEEAGETLVHMDLPVLDDGCHKCHPRTYRPGTAAYCDKHRCTAISRYGAPGQGHRGQRCRNARRSGEDVCSSHAWAEAAPQYVLNAEERAAARAVADSFPDPPRHLLVTRLPVPVSPLREQNGRPSLAQILEM